MLDKSPVMWTRDLTKEAHPAFCSAGTADPRDISSNHTAGRQRSVTSCDTWGSPSQRRAKMVNVPASASDIFVDVVFVWIGY